MSAQPQPLRVAVAQLCSKDNIEANLEVCREQIERSAALGAQLVAFPETAPFIGPPRLRQAAVQPLEGFLVQRFAQMAREAGIAVLVGSVFEAHPEGGRCYNTSVFLDEQGQLVASYRKLHLFDADLPNGTSLRESDTFLAGDQVVVVHWRGWTFGMSICYDLRFPELYRRLAHQGAQVLLVPSAFTERTGRDHWEVLLRARAIENQCYVIAPNQWGLHTEGRRSYGRSMVIDPWGTVQAQVGDHIGLALAELDPERVQQIRQGMPCLRHARLLPEGP